MLALLTLPYIGIGYGASYLRQRVAARHHDS